MKKNLFLLLGAFLAFSLVTSCEKENSSNDDPNDGGGTNWWYRAAMGPEGVKSITCVGDYDDIVKFDKDGKITYRKEWSTETTYEYDSNNYLIKTIETTQKNTPIETLYEYKNKGKFVPTETFHWKDMGLVPELSRTVNLSNGDTTSVSSFNFLANGNLEIELTDKYHIYRDTIVYNGAYPTEYYDGRWMYIGPCTYQANGMFDVYKEGFHAPGQQAENARTYYFSKEFSAKMLIIKDEEITPKDRSETKYEYDSKGNPVKITRNYYGTSPEYNTVAVTTYQYSYDKNDNWTSRTVHYTETNQQDNEYEETRIIEYY